MRNTKKRNVVVAVLVLVGIFVYYRYAKEVFQPAQNQVITIPAETASHTREVSAEIAFDIPADYSEQVRFVVALDESGRIQSIKTVDVATNEVSEKKKEFDALITTTLKGKKLSELGPIDKVGKSSLTTKAFNDSLEKLKAQL